MVKYNGKDYGEARPVDLYANTKVKRNSDFTGELEAAATDSLSAGGLP
jgi:hypothetical protein